MKKPVDPTTPEEWQEAVDQAEALLLVHSARLYGLIRGGPQVNVARCDQILERGRRRSITPSKEAVDRYILALC